MLPCRVQANFKHAVVLVSAGAHSAPLDTIIAYFKNPMLAEYDYLQEGCDWMETTVATWSNFLSAREPRQKNACCNRINRSCAITRSKRCVLE